MRAAPKNFSFEELVNGTNLAHSMGKKVYITCNIFPHDSVIHILPDFIARSRDAGVDAFIAADLGVIKKIKEIAPKTDIHVSTQAGIINSETANIYFDMGVKRIVPAREMSLDEIAYLRAHTDKELEIECFVHGAMCMSFSGRCLLSSYMVSRDANLGMCAQPCRWQFDITDITRPGIKYSVQEDDNGTYFMNSRDMRMIEHIQEMYEAGIDSFKIEGRAKSAYYTAVVTNAYRQALDGFYSCVSKHYEPEQWIIDETEKVSHREYCTGFYFEHPDKNANIDYNGGYIRSWDVAAVVEKCENGIITLSQRNKFSVDDTLEVLEPQKKPVPFNIKNIYDDDMHIIESANHAMMTIKIKSDEIYTTGALVRKKAE
jgi:putative protease